MEHIHIYPAGLPPAGERKFSEYDSTEYRKRVEMTIAAKEIERPPTRHGHRQAGKCVRFETDTNASSKVTKNRDKKV